MPSFLHDGKLGDIVFSLPTVERLGGGVMFLSLGALLNIKTFHVIAPLLKNQDCIEDVRIYEGGPIDYDLTTYRHSKFLIETGQVDEPPRNLVDYFAHPFGILDIDHSKRWLKPIPPLSLPGRDIAVFLTPRYFNQNVNWAYLLKSLEDRLFFVGLKKEWIDFCRYSKINLPHFPTKDYLELQAVLEGSCRIYCGMGGVHAVAEGIKMPITLSITDSHDCLFEREGVEYLLHYG